MRLAKNWLEWSVFAIGTIIVVAAVAILVRAAVRTGETPPQLVVQLGTPVAEAGRHRVPVSVENRGDITAAEAVIAIELRDGDTVVERGEVAFIFIPRRAKREGAVVFARDPRCCRVTVGAIGFETAD